MIITLERNQSWVSVGFWTSYSNGTNVTDIKLIEVREGFYVYSVVDLDYERTYTKHSDCKDYFPCYINLTSPIGAGMHRVTFFFSYKLGGQNSSRSSKALYVNKILDPTPIPVALQVIEYLFPPTIAYATPLEILVQQITADGSTVPFDQFGAPGEAEAATLVLAPQDPASHCESVSVGGLQSLTVSDFTTQIGCFIGGITLSGGVYTRTDPSDATSRVYLPLHQRATQVLHCANIVVGPRVSFGIQFASYAAPRAPVISPSEQFAQLSHAHTMNGIRQFEVRSANYRDPNLMWWANASQYRPFIPSSPTDDVLIGGTVRWIVSNPIATFVWLGEHACRVVPDDDSIVDEYGRQIVLFSNAALETITNGGCEIVCVFRNVDLTVPRRGLLRLELLYQPASLPYPLEVPVMTFVLNSGRPEALLVSRQGLWSHPLAPHPDSSLSAWQTVRVYMPHTCVELAFQDSIGNLVPAPPRTLVSLYTNASVNVPHHLTKFVGSIWSNGTVYERICNWTLPLNISTVTAQANNAFVERSVVVSVTQPGGGFRQLNTTVPIELYTQATCMTPLTVVQIVGCTSCNSSLDLCDCSIVSRITGLVRPTDTAPIDSIQIQGRRCHYGTIAVPPTGNGYLEVSQCAVAEYPNLLSSVPSLRPAGLTILQSSGRYVDSPAHVYLRPYAAADLQIIQLLGCNDTRASPSIADCDVTGATTDITIIGQNFQADYGVRITTAFSGPNVCESVQFMNSSCIIASGCKGFGLQGVVSFYPVEDPNQDIVPANVHNCTVSFFIQFEDECPRDSLTGTLCSGNGVCDQHTGLCNCFTDDVNGFWSGDSCDVCTNFYRNSFRCLTACPIGEGGFPCSDRGECFDGVCVCTDTTSTGLACERKCATTTTLPCSGHGTCTSDETCDCYSDGFLGFFNGTSCATCASGWSGDDCTTACPVGEDAAVCSGHGECYSGGCVCATGYCGHACTSTNCSASTGVTTSTCANDCSGHGVCDASRGVCLCEADFGGYDCSGVCPDLGRCSGHGACLDDGYLCLCAPRYSGYDCSVTCPGYLPATGELCNGHGVCSKPGDFTLPYCTCLEGYVTSDCSVSCSCGEHGTCRTDGTCLCDATDRLGYWAGSVCQTCAAFAAGARCDVVCPHNGTTTCSGNGECSADGCSCYRSASTGNWAGTNCTVCQAGFYGPQCKQECPGGSCLACTGHGTCSDGTRGTGICACDTNWTGTNCSSCIAGHYGANCSFVCPATCGRAGNCSSGPTGTGACICNAGFALDASGQCNICAVGHFGDRCFGCNTDAAGNICSGKGTCVLDVSTGNGMCNCTAPHGGSICQYQCPVFLGLTCGTSTASSCIADAVCVCSDNFLLSSGTCSKCLPGFYGTKCTAVCPACVNGVCSAGPTGTGRCVCSNGYWGTLCTEGCPGGSSNPCSGHGICNATTGTCSCDANSVGGFYTGAACSTCIPAYQSTNCTTPCPVDASGNLCSGRGTCNNGVCTNCIARSTDFYSTYCGNQCTVAGRSCFTFVNDCPEGLFGSSCQFLCPGVTSANGSNSCNNNGFCSPDTGYCNCFGGFFGSSCSDTCPKGFAYTANTTTGVATACSAQGTCSLGACTCDYGFFGAACDKIGPGGVNAICLLRGTMQNDGSCECNEGYFGTSCELLCPGMASSGKSCNGNGNCAATGTCVCFNSPVQGFFQGADCSLCRNGYGGGACLETCNPASSITVGAQCSCFPGFWGTYCYDECPGKREISSFESTYCNEHGTCYDGYAGNGTCECDASYYGANCNIRCTTLLCNAQGLLMTMCNSNGTCVCLETDTQHWDGSTCSVCKLGFWGDFCDRTCACSNNGACAKESGVCQCYSDSTNGFWTGITCSQCQSNYVGTQCTALNVIMTLDESQTAAFPAAFDHSTSAAVYFLDVENDRTYAGNNPLLIFQTSTRNLAGTLSLTFDDSLTDVDVTLVSYLITYNATYITLQTTNYIVTRQRYFVPRHAVTSLSDADVIVDDRSAIGTPQVFVFGGGPSSLTYGQHRGFDVLTLIDTTSTAIGIDGSWRIDVSGGGPIIISMDDVNLVYEIPFSAHNFATVSSASILQGRGLAIVTGISAITSEWQIIRIRNIDPTDNGQSLVVLSVSFLDISISQCFLPSLCPEVLRCDDASSGSYIYCIFRYESGPLFVRITDGITLVSQWQTKSVLITGTTATYSITAATYSEDLGYGFLGYQVVDTITPGQIIKMNTADVSVSSVYGLVLTETASSFTLDAVTRRLAVVVLSPIGIRVITLQFFGVRSVSPSVIDNRGGVVVTVLGEAFPNEPIWCQFYGVNDTTYESIATYVNASVLTCIAVATPPTSLCDPIEFNVRTATQSTQSTGVFISRPLPVDLSAVTSSLGYNGYTSALTSDAITVTGYMFVQSTSARCVINDTVAGELTDMALTFVDQSTIVCEQIARDGPTNPGTVLSYSHDGLLFAPTPILFTLVGLAAGFQIQAGALTFPAAITAQVPTVVLMLIDSLGNEIRLTQQSDIIVTASIVLGNSTNVYTLSSASASQVSCSDGFATFDKLYMDTPLAGIATILFSAVQGFRLSVEYVVSPGIPHHIELRNPSRTSWIVGITEAQVLNPAPLAMVADIAGNQLSDATVIPPTLEVTFIKRVYDADRKVVDTGTVVFAAGTNIDVLYEFTGVSVQSVFGTTVTLVFQAPSSYTSYAIVATVFTLDALEACSAESYAITGTSLCEICPEFGTCDGTTSVAVQPGHWRANIGTYVFYDCSPPFSSSVACSTGFCTTGYTGPRCSVCDEGYGHSGLTCSTCPPVLTSAVVITLLCVAIVAGVTFLTISSVTSGKEAAEGGAHNNTSLLIKLLLNHFQMTGTVVSLTAAMPSLLSSFLSTQGQASISVNLAFLSCTITPNFFSQYTMTMVLPVLVVGVFLGVMAVYSKVEIHFAVEEYDKNIKALEIEQELLNTRRQNLDETVFEECVEPTQDVPKVFLDIMTNAFNKLDNEQRTMTANSMANSRNNGSNTWANRVGSRGNSGFTMIPLALKHQQRHSLTSLHSASASTEVSPRNESGNKQRSAVFSPRESSGGGSAGENFFLTSIREETSMVEEKLASSNSQDTPLMPDAQPHVQESSPRHGSMTLHNSWFNVKSLLRRGSEQGSPTSPSSPRGAFSDRSGGGGTRRSSVNDFAAFVDDVTAPQSRGASRSNSIHVHDSFLLKSQGPAGSRRVKTIRFENVETALSDVDDDEDYLDAHQKRIQQSGMYFDEESDDDNQCDDADSPKLARRTSSTFGGGFTMRRSFVEEVKAPVWAVNADDNDRLLTRSQLVINKLQAEIVQEIDARHKDLTENHVIATSFLHNWFDFMTVATVIILFFLYPTILQVCANLLQCESLIVSGTGDQISVLVVDRSIDCNSAEYNKYKGLALISLAVYGLGIPLLCIALVLIVGFVKNDQQAARTLFFFTTGGFKTQYWFSEVISLLRKAVLVVLTQSITDDTVRGVLCTWSISIFLVVNLMMNPWQDEELQLLENCSLACITVTFNLMQVLVRYDPTSFEANFIAVLILVVNIMIFVVFVRRLILDAQGFLLHHAHTGSKLARFATWILRIRPSEEQLAEQTMHIQQDIETTGKMFGSSHHRLFALYDLTESEVNDALLFEHKEDLKEEGRFLNEKSADFKLLLLDFRHQSRQLSKRHSIAELVKDEQGAGGGINKVLRMLTRRTSQGLHDMGGLLHDVAIDTTAILAAPNTSIAQPVYKVFTTLQMTLYMLGELSKVTGWTTFNEDDENEALQVHAAQADGNNILSIGAAAGGHATGEGSNGFTPTDEANTDPQVQLQQQISPPPLQPLHHSGVLMYDVLTPQTMVLGQRRLGVSGYTGSHNMHSHSDEASRSSRHSNDQSHSDDFHTTGLGPLAVPRARRNDGGGGDGRTPHPFGDDLESQTATSRHVAPVGSHEEGNQLPNFAVPGGANVPRPEAHVGELERLEELAEDIGRIKATDALESVFAMEIAVMQKVLASVQRRRAVEQARVNALRNRITYDPDED
jgi:hypothetical protein